MYTAVLLKTTLARQWQKITFRAAFESWSRSLTSTWKIALKKMLPSMDPAEVRSMLSSQIRVYVSYSTFFLFLRVYQALFKVK